MKSQMIEMGEKKKIALVAHDKKKSGLLEWAKLNRDPLAGHVPYATGTTEKFLEQKLKSGPQEFLDQKLTGKDIENRGRRQKGTIGNMRG